MKGKVIKDLPEREEEPEEEFDAARPFAPHPFNTVVQPPTIWIAQEAYNDMLMIVDESPIEVGWLGIVEQLQGGGLLIGEIFMPEQDCSAVVTKMSANGVAEIGQKILARKNGTELYNKLRFWGHSHVDMDTGSSVQDDIQLEEFAQNACDFFIRGILNKRGKIEFTIAYYKLGMTITDVPWSVIHPVSDHRRQFWRKQLDQKVSQHVPAHSNWKAGPWNSNWTDYGRPRSRAGDLLDRSEVEREERDFPHHHGH